jgi:hypothetical protein
VEGAAPNLEKLYEQKITKKLSYSMQALLGLHKDRDRQLVGLMNKAVIPPLLVQAKNWYQYMIKTARSPRFGLVLSGIYDDMISPLVDLFTPYPIPIETLLKDQATDQGEINVFGVPEKRGRRSSEEYDEDERDYDLDRLEENMRGKLEGAFTGPEDSDEDKESPFLSFGDGEDD